MPAQRSSQTRAGKRAYAFLSAALLLTAGRAQTPAQLVSAMAAHEIAARNQDDLFSFHQEERSPRTGGHLWTENVIETTDGPLHRLLAIDGRPLTQSESRTEADRIRDIVLHPEDFRRAAASHKDDEVHAQRLLNLLPRGFLITPAGESNGCAQFTFRANPDFQPSTYEERVAAAMTGTVSIKLPTSKEPMPRLCSLEGSIAHPVEFGFGLLGRVAQGGRFHLERRPVDATHWKSSLISVHIQGRILLLKTLTREQEATRTEIRLLPATVSLAQAAQTILQ